ncbi:MAG: S1 family peptidase [Pseudonocardiaceae bacterium]
MGGWVDSRELRRHVVRVDNDDGPQGTGFFVAPGWVLTCAHVVKDADRLSLVPAGGGSPIPGVVEARSAPHAGGRSAFWPFPDLALVSTSLTDHPCVLLDPRGPLEGECHAWGYPEREDYIEPTGSPASFLFEGVEGDDYLKLKAGQAAPGLSGAPLVCPGRRAVVGAASRGRGHGGDPAPT